MATYAHSRNAHGERHDLVAHLRGVADLAARFANAFGAAELGHYLGLWHDIGKFDPAWQRYLLMSEAGTATRRDQTDHKGAGTRLAIDHVGALGLLIHGHHGGLRDQADFRAFVEGRLQENAVAEALALARQAIPDLEPATSLTLPDAVRRTPRTAELYMRMLFSALVDADSLDTERHASEEQARLRGADVSLETLWDRFAADQARLLAGPDSHVNQIRREVYRQCLEAAALPPGLFRLTVPTGGGKTRSGMGFALRHALRNGMKRIVVAVPFLTITDQTVQTYQEIFSDHDHTRPVVLEHHSMAGRDVGDDEEDFAPRAVASSLGCCIRSTGRMSCSSPNPPTRAAQNAPRPLQRSHSRRLSVSPARGPR